MSKACESATRTFLKCEGSSVNARFQVNWVEVVRIYGLKREEVNCLREVFEIFFKFNKILCMNSEQKLG